MKPTRWEKNNQITQANNKNTRKVSVFETTIRELGGLLSAFDLSGDPVFVDKAERLGAKLLPAFDTPSGLPKSSVSLSGGGLRGGGGGEAVLAELGSLQLEFRWAQSDIPPCARGGSQSRANLSRES